MEAIPKISKKHKIKIAIAPPQHMLSQIALCSKKGVLVLAQHVDDTKTGSTTGFMVPELLKKSKVVGALINHSEHRISPQQIKNTVNKLRQLEMTSILCVANIAEVKKYVKLNPDYIAIEPPELIGGSKAISNERPGLITDAVKVINQAAVTKTKTRTKLLCGAGIVSGQDVAKAANLGSSGILVASGIIKSKNWEKVITEFAWAMR